MKRIQIFGLVTTLGLSLSIGPGVEAKTMITKPSAPTIVSISSSAPKNGKVNVKVTIKLPTSSGGSKISGSKVTAGDKSCTIKDLKTSCTIKNIKKGKSLSVKASSKNKKGFGPKSATVKYVSGDSKWSSKPKPKPALRIIKNTCSATTSADNCDVYWEAKEDSEFSWSRVCGVKVDGGYSPRGGGVNILLTGVAKSCYLTIVSTNIATSRITTLEVPIKIRGLYPIPVFSISKNTCTAEVTTQTCVINWSVDEDSTFSWPEVCEVLPDGGYSTRDGWVEIDLSGGPSTCPFSIRATSIETGRSSVKEFVVTKPMCIYQAGLQLRALPFGC